MKILFCLVLIPLFASSSMAQTSLEEKITDSATGEVLISANIVIEKNGVYIAGTSTDFNGNYSIQLGPGKYNMKIHYIGYPENLIEGIIVNKEQANKLNVKMEEGFSPLSVFLMELNIPMIEQDNTTSGSVIRSEEIRNYPSRDIKDIIINTPGVSHLNF